MPLMWQYTPPGGVTPRHCTKGFFLQQHVFPGDASRGNDLAGGVDVVQKGVEGADPLGAALGHAVPLVAVDHPGDHVEGDDAFVGVAVVVDAEGGARVEQGALGGPLPDAQVAVGHLRDTLHDLGGPAAGDPLGIDQFVVEAVGPVGTEVHGHVLTR